MTAAPILLDLGGRVVPVAVRASPLARRMSLRIDPAAGPVVVMPAGARRADAERFLTHNRVWLAERLARLPQRVPLVPGARIPLLGIDHDIRHVPEARRGVWVADGGLNISGRIEHVPRRALDFLRAEARRHLHTRAFDLSARIGRTPCRVSVRDTRSRWGSCSSRGDLSFSWRLVLAPEPVLAYVVAHEVAHLVHMNHSPAFWAVVAELVGDPRAAKRWLKANGAGLHLYG
ncbi:MAG: SprT family zinc-dependent metalloprotease [Magnetospirillum sp.]|nr:SprT family zinc-dependent metalloprotease [Magnetospirillum sp.]